MAARRPRALDAFFGGAQGGSQGSAKVPRRTAEGSAFAPCPVCGTSVALLRINDHLDSAECGAASAAPLSAPAAAAPASAPRSPTPPLLAARPPLADALRWHDDAAPSSRRYGQNTGRAAGVLPPAPPPPPPPGASLRAPGGAAMEQLLAADAADAGDDSDGDGDAPAAKQGQQVGPATNALNELSVQRTYGLGGHLVIEDFLSPAEEASLLAAVEGPASPPWRFVSFNGKSRGKEWGADMDLAAREVYPPVVPFPPWLDDVVAKLRRAHPLLRRFSPNHANAIEYVRSRGDYLVAHVDDRRLSGDVIVNLSLAGSCVMTYAPEPRGGVPRGKAARRAGDAPPPSAPGVVRVGLPRRAAQVQSGASRFEFTHAIAGRDLIHEKRISITLRESPVTRPKRPPREQR